MVQKIKGVLFMKKTFKFGFTLAEILVTLSILGLVAAITIPSTINNYKKRQIITGLQIANSTLSNALLQSEAINGHISTWDFQNFDNCCSTKYAEEFATTYLTPNLNVMYNCTFDREDNRCFGKKNHIVGLSGLDLQTYTGGSGSYMFRLKNGLSYAVKKYSNNGKKVLIAVDINGPDKGESKAGVDVFYFQMTPEKGLEPFGDGGDGCQWANAASGAAGTGGAGSTCAALIINNNWKFPSNYPLKFNPANYSYWVMDPVTGGWYGINCANTAAFEAYNKKQCQKKQNDGNIPQEEDCNDKNVRLNYGISETSCYGK